MADEPTALPQEQRIEQGAPDLTPAEWHKRWTTELDAAKKRLDDWHKDVVEIEADYLSEYDAKRDGQRHRAYFTSNVQVQDAMLYGQLPKTNVSRRFADSADDRARVAGEALQRLLNQDIERDGDNFADTLRLNLLDMLLAGFASMRLRYDVRWETVPERPAMMDPTTGAMLAPAVPCCERKVWEDAETDYVHWRDMLWSVSRVWQEVRWVAFRAELPRKKLVEMFGEEPGARLPLDVKQGALDDDPKKASPWDRAEGWEIWDGESRRVFWWFAGHKQVLFPVDNPTGKDPLGLEGFFPCPRPIIRNATNSKLVPRPDRKIHRDLYREIDDVSTRIVTLEEAIRVTGLYDKQAGSEVAKLLDGTTGNKLYPSDKWQLLAEKGGIAGCVDWFPLEQVVSALAVLRDYRRELVDELYQLTGMGDILRGQASVPGATATEQGLKAKFGSIRMQRAQDEFARYATDAQKLRAEIVSKHFDVETILARANVAFMPEADRAVAQEAAQLLKSDLVQYRIEVKPEAVSMTDFVALRQERSELVTAISQYLGAVEPLFRQVPGAAPMLLEILQWMVAGLRGSSTIEGVLDRAIALAEQAAAKAQEAGPAAAPPDPKLAAIEAKGRIEMAKIQAELQADLARSQADAQAEDAKQQSQATWNLRERAASQQLTQASRAMAPQPGPGPVLPLVRGPAGGGL